MVTIHNDMYDRALRNTQEKTFTATTFDEFVDTAKNKPGFIKAMWCGETACEEKIKEVTGGVKSRCIPFNEEHLSDVCVWLAAAMQAYGILGQAVLICK